MSMSTQLLDQTNAVPRSTDDELPPVRLTSQQMDAVLAAAHPLPHDRRADFLIDVVRQLSALPEVGDGAIHRIVTVVQRKYFDAPIETEPHHRHGGKYGR
jgi:hypothetical protein